jgi:ATP-dependent 26S proteasome regulatory subunit
LVAYLSQVHAVDEAEFEALEKQIEQLESDEKKKAEAAAKRKAEAEKQRLEEIKRTAEEARLAELERQRQEEEAKKRAEEQRLAEEETKRLNAIPNISGTWTGISDGGTKTSSKYIINQDGSNLRGRFFDELLDGTPLVKNWHHNNGSIYGTVDNVGNVNITIDFGRVEVKPGDKRVVKSFNELKLSINENELTGTWTNTLGGSGSVHLVKE